MQKINITSLIEELWFDYILFGESICEINIDNAFNVVVNILSPINNSFKSYLYKENCLSIEEAQVHKTYLSQAIQKSFNVG
jgi:hypothetical protein